MSVATTSAVDRHGTSSTKLSVDTANLSVITMRADDGDGGITEDSVEVLVVSDASQLPTPTDALGVGPELISFGAGSHPAMISIDNANLENSIAWNATSSASWVVLDVADGTTPAQIQARLDAQGLAPGEYEASLTFSSPEVPGHSVVVEVEAVIAATVCVGDCEGGGTVTVDELITGINIALGIVDSAQCSVFDASGDGDITVDELLQGVNNALAGCAG